MALDEGEHKAECDCSSVGTFSTDTMAVPFARQQGENLSTVDMIFCVVPYRFLIHVDPNASSMIVHLLSARSTVSVPKNPLFIDFDNSSWP